MMFPADERDLEGILRHAERLDSEPSRLAPLGHSDVSREWPGPGSGPGPR
jgi:hypothetical protein